MAVTTSQYNRLLVRMTKLEELVNDMLTASDQYITLGQMNQLSTLWQTEFDNIQTQVTALEDRVTGIEEEPLV